VVPATGASVNALSTNVAGHGNTGRQEQRLMCSFMPANPPFSVSVQFPGLR
jgi:hypothetical protein